LPTHFSQHVDVSCVISTNP